VEQLEAPHTMAERAWIRGAVVERVERVVPAAEARLVLVERLHRAHARRRDGAFLLAANCWLSVFSSPWSLSVFYWWARGQGIDLLWFRRVFFSEIVRVETTR
jgi:hypothetical protein